MNSKTISGADFKLHFQSLLATIGDNDQVSFGAGDLSFYCIKNRGPKEGPQRFQIEFNEAYSVTADPDKS